MSSLVNTGRVNDTDEIWPFCSVATAASILGMPTITASRHARAGKLPVLGRLDGKTGAYVLDRAAVERLAAERAAS